MIKPKEKNTAQKQDRSFINYILKVMETLMYSEDWLNDF